MSRSNRDDTSDPVLWWISLMWKVLEGHSATWTIPCILLCVLRRDRNFIYKGSRALPKWEHRSIRDKFALIPTAPSHSKQPELPRNI